MKESLLEENHINYKNDFDQKGKKMFINRSQPTLGTSHNHHTKAMFHDKHHYQK